MPAETRVTFHVDDTPLVGTLHLPDGEGRHPAVVVDGPLTSVKEQAAGNHARALAERGFVALAFDHRHFGESGGSPRQYESPPAKIVDLRAAVDFLARHEAVDPDRIAALGVCAGAGYVAGAVAEDRRVRAFATVAGFFHDAAMQRKWMGDGYEAAVAGGVAARERYEATGLAETIPAVGKEGPVAMPLAEAYEYYGTPRGGVPNYVNAFALMSREFTLPYDAQSHAAKIDVPTRIIHSEKALAPPLARNFYDNLAGPKDLHWLASQGQIDFYDDPALIAASADLVADHFRRHLA
ncbi:MAG: alpha/beta hydrolase [Myxococcales bacterium]|nr:alpha/beta hydrolase [Myxococcales bacterium]